MKILNNKSYPNQFIHLMNTDWLEKQRIAGKVVSQTLNLLQEQVKNNLSLLQLDKLAEQFILDNNCIPTFKNYKGFPNACCISVNKQLVHGIPTNYYPQEGDVISFDLGATYQQAIADSAITCVIGNATSKQKDLILATEYALYKGILAISLNKRLGCIGEAIYKSAKNYGVIQHYGGHSISWNKPHAEPFVSNKDSENNGIRIQPGLVLAIEPMLTSGSTKTYVDNDKWTVYCEADLSAHFEHSIYVHDDHVEILTYRENENYLKSNKLYFKDTYENTV